MQITFNMSAFTYKAQGVEVKVDPSKWTPEQAEHMVAGLVAQGLTIILQRSGAGADDKVKALKNKAEALQTGDYAFGGGGTRGPKADFETLAERFILAGYAQDELGMTATTAKAWAKKDPWPEVTRRFILNEAIEEGMEEEEIKALDLPALIEEYMDTVKIAFAEAIAEKAKELRKAKEPKKLHTGKKLGIKK
jgi:hypothetical protein